MKFVFRARDQKGEIREGEVDAFSKRAALELLQKNGLIPVSVREEARTPKVVKDLLRSWEGVRKKDLVVFFRQLAILIEARVPISVALLTLKEQTDNKYLGKIAEEIRADVEDGAPLSEAMGKHKDTFSSLIINMVAAGEASGNLQTSIDYLADNIEANYQLTSKVKGAMIYPGVILTVFMIVGFFVVSFIIPKISEVIRDLGADVPWYTQFVMASGDFMSKYWWAVILLLIGFVIALAYYIKTENGRREWDLIKIRLPIFGKIFRYVYVTRFADNFGTLLAGGVPIAKSLKIVGAVVGNTEIQRLISRAEDEVRTGNTISGTFIRSIYVPPMVSQMIKVGEETGKLEMALKNVADFYQKETDRMTKNMTTLIEPILMIVMAIAVAFLVFSVLLPIYNLANQL